MHDDGLEDRLRQVLSDEGDALPLTITTAELERRLALRRRERVGRRASVLAAALAVVAVGSLVATAGGWFRSLSVGAGPAPASSASPAPSEPALPCETIDPASMDQPPTLLMGVTPGDARAVGGHGSSYRLGDRQVGEEGTWNLDSIGFESVTAGFPTARIQVLASEPDACLIGLEVDARPSDRFGDEPIRIADVISEPNRVLEFDRPPAGDWLVRVHAEFATTSGAAAWRETFFAIEVSDCAPLDRASTILPVVRMAAPQESDVSPHPGTQVASAIGGDVDGAQGTWEGLPTGPDQIVVSPGFDGLQLVSDACMVDVRVEALLTVGAQVPEPALPPIELPVRHGEGSPIVSIGPPPTGGWTVRVRATFPLADGGEAWSETLFRVASRFLAPGLTVEPGFFEVVADAGCPSYQLTSGASAADQCGAPYELMEGRDPIPVATGASLRFRLEDAWVVDQARTIAVDAELVARGDFAPEYSVDFQENVGPILTVPITLDPGSWILRITLNGNRQGDTFGAYYDIGVTVTP